MKMNFFLLITAIVGWAIARNNTLDRFPIRIILMERDITKMYLECVKELKSCKLDSFEPKGQTNLTITLDKEANRDFGVEKFKLSSMKTTNFNQLDYFQIDLEGIEVEIDRSTIGSQFMEMRAKVVTISYSLFEYKKIIFEADSELVFMNTNFIPSYSEYCSEEITKTVFDKVFEDEERRRGDPDYDERDCDLDDVTAQGIVSKHIKKTEGDTGGSDESYIALISDKISLKNSTTIKANTIITSRILELSNSIITSSESGCSKAKLKGSPKMFISHSFQCELNAGSYGGRGGVGLSKSTQNSQECIKNAYSRMTTYGDAFRPMAGGATGGNYLATRRSEEVAPGAIAVVTNVLVMDCNSKIVSGYDPILEVGAPSSSGGSVFVSGKRFEVNGTIHANGQSSNHTSFGEGAGGRVFVRNLCWFKKGSFLSNRDTFIEAKKGLRTGVYKKFKSSFPRDKDEQELGYLIKLISAENGSVKSSPCLQGYEGVLCKKCEEGWIKEDYLEERCDRCRNSQSGGKLRYEASPYNCHEYRCDKKVKILRVINEHCLLNYDLINFYFIRYHQIFIRYFFTFLGFMCLFDLVRWFSRESSYEKLATPIKLTKLEKIFDEKIPLNRNKKVTLSFQGLNSPYSPWFLEFEVCKEFNSSFMLKGEVLALRREINRISKWSKINRLILCVVRYLFPFLQKKYKLRVRKKIFKKILNYLKILNLTNKQKYTQGEAKAYNYILWTDSTFSVAQVTIVHLGDKETIRRPFNILIKGNCTTDHHLRLAFNPLCLKQDLLLQFPKLKKTEINSHAQYLRDKILGINSILRQISADDDSMYFYYKMVNLMKQIDILNERVLSGYKLTCRLVLVEHLVYKLENLNYQYNKLVLVNSKSMDRLELLRSYIQSVNSSKNFEPQFSLTFLPGGNSAYLELTSMMHKHKNSTNIFNLPFKSELHIEEKRKSKKKLIKSNRVDLKNLNTNLESLREFKKIKRKSCFDNLFSSNTRWFQDLNQRPINISLSIGETYILRICLLLLFTFDWILISLYIGLMLFHTGNMAREILTVNLFFPYFIPFFYSFFCQLLWIFRYKHKELKFLAKVNSFCIVNLAFSSVGLAYYILAVLDDEDYVMSALPCLFGVVKFSQNYLIRCLNGSVMNDFISMVNQRLRTQEEEEGDDSSDVG